MNVGAAHWLKRVFGISILVLVPTLLGCGSPKRDFIDTSVDAAHAFGLAGPRFGHRLRQPTRYIDRKRYIDNRHVDGDGCESRTVTQGDGRDATSDLRRDGSDASSEPGIDAPVDINVPDIVVDVDNNPPTIVDTIPANNAMAVAVGTTIYRRVFEADESREHGFDAPADGAARCGRLESGVHVGRIHPALPSGCDDQLHRDGSRIRTPAVARSQARRPSPSPPGPAPT